MAPAPIGPVGIGSSGGSTDFPREPSEQEQEHHIARCKRCGKETELIDGLCTECRWEINVGLQQPLQQEKKHHFWSHDKR